MRALPALPPQAEADATAMDSSRAFLAKLRDTLLSEAGVKPANVKIVPLPSNTATCEPAARLPGRAWRRRQRGWLPLPARHACHVPPFSHGLIAAPPRVLSALLPAPAATRAAGDVGRTISDYAAAHKADAVVVGSRGLGAFRRRFMGMLGLGSVSDYVAHHVSCAGRCWLAGWLAG